MYSCKKHHLKESEHSFAAKHHPFSTKKKSKSQVHYDGELVSARSRLAYTRENIYYMDWSNADKMTLANIDFISKEIGSKLGEKDEQDKQLDEDVDLQDKEYQDTKFELSDNDLDFKQNIDPTVEFASNNIEEIEDPSLLDFDDDFALSNEEMRRIPSNKDYENENGEEDSDEIAATSNKIKVPRGKV
ncbi:hypothetical protein PanWU01x14_044900 [Parasponia andersonii]|uniref:Uncharacterized protein n=1 Tax=Parasponia andersonii TaxID=3476 RepID=A0A2P5DPD2_PARAD|nr:hypothetical protein PanWU01x14_044900 [Parasponia andersonii]